MGESLDIVAKIDQLGTPILQEPADRTDIDQWMKERGAGGAEAREARRSPRGLRERLGCQVPCFPPVGI